MDYILILKSVLMCAIVFKISSTTYTPAKTYTALNSIVFTNIRPPKGNVHSEYYFGKCAIINKLLLAHEYLTYEEIKGNLIIRGFLNITREPNCVYIKSSSPYGDMVRYRSDKFSICVTKIVYYYLGNATVYHFYEWFVPVDMKRDINWDLYFYRAYV